MTFDAGSIEAQLTLDRTPFQAGLAAAKREARDFTRQRITAMLDVDADTRKARASIERMKRGFDRKTTIDVDIDAGKAEAELATLRAQLAATKRSASDLGEQSAFSFGKLFDAIVILGPALVPLASGLLGLSASMIGLGVDGVLAFKGINKEVQQGTALGREYITMGKTLNQGLGQLEQTAARGVLTPLQKEVSQLNRDFPMLNQFVQRTAGLGGDILGHGADALLHLFMTAEPLIVTSEQAIDKLVTRLDNWASSGGGQSFFHALAADIPVTINTIGDLFSVVGRLVQGLEPVGHVILGIVDGGLKVIDTIEKIPGAVTVLTTVLIGYRIKVLLAAAANSVLAKTFGDAAVAESAETIALRENTAALVANAGARRLAGGAAGLSSVRAYGGAAAAGAASEGELAAAGAGGGLLARASSFALTRALPWAILSYLGGSTLKKLTGPLNNSQSQNTRAVGAGLDTVGDILTFKPITGAPSAIKDLFSGNFGSIFGDLLPSAARDAKNNDAIMRRQAEQAWVNSVLRERVYTGQGTTTQGSQIYQDYWSSQAIKYAQQQGAVNNRLTGNLGQQFDPNKIADANNNVTTSIQKRMDAEQKLFDTSKGEITLTNGLTVSYAAYQAEMKSTGNDLEATTQFFMAHKDAQVADSEALDDLSRRTSLYNRFLTDSTVKYKVGEQNIGTYSAALGLNYDKITKNATAEKAAAAALGAANDKFANGNAAMQGWLATISQVDLSSDSLTQRVTLLGAGLNALRGTQLDMAGANLNAVSSLEAASNAIDQNSNVIGKNGQLLGQLVKTQHGYVVEQPKLTANSLQVQQAMAGAAQQAIALAQSIYQNTGNARQAYSAYEGLRSQFVSTMIQAGKTRTEAEGLARQIFGIPKNASTFVKLLNKDNVAAAIRDLTGKLGNFSKIIARALVKIDGTDKAKTDLGTIIGQMGAINNTPISPKIIIPPHTGLVVTGGNAGVNTGSQPQQPGGAHGMIVTQGTTSTADDVLIRVSKGEAVIPADQTSKHYGLVRSLINKTHGYASGYIPPSLITDSGGSGGGSSSGSKKQPPAWLTNLLSALSGFLPTHQTGDLGSLSSQSMTVVRNTLASIVADFKAIHEHGKLSAGEITRFRRESDAYMNTLTRSRALAAQITKDKNKLQNVSGERSNVMNTVLGSFDIGTSGNGYQYGITASLDQDINDASKFANLRKQAKSLGLSPALLKQLTEEGPQVAGANLQAIVSGGKDYVSNLNKKYAKLKSIGGMLGDAQTQDTYGTTQTKLTEKIHNEEKHQTALQHELARELKGLRSDVAKVVRELKVAARQ